MCCTAGAAFHVIVDIRSSSPTFKRWLAVELSADNHRMLYIAEGFAHGFQTLADHTELFYQMSKEYDPQAVRGIRWDDSELAIEWPATPPRAISSQDLRLPTIATLDLGLSR